MAGERIRADILAGGAAANAVLKELFSPPICSVVEAPAVDAALQVFEIWRDVCSAFGRLLVPVKNEDPKPTGIADADAEQRNGSMPAA